MNILLLGSGGRESALAWRISLNNNSGTLYIAPGNGGTQEYGTNVSLNPMNFAEVKEFIKKNSIELVVVGNEDPLVAGVRDFLENTEVLIVGPNADGARLEGSKDFAKGFMMRHGIPTAQYKSFDRTKISQGFEFLSTLTPPYVLKADGLAAGKGVLIIDDIEEAKTALIEMVEGKFGESSSTVVIEEFLSGIECSVFVMTDGKGQYRILPVAKDYKRVGEGDTGPNTGGMGAVSPVKFADDAFMKKVEDKIIIPTINGLIEEGIDYRGFIFLGLINVKGEPFVIEYNVRMGDPETEAVMPRIEGNFLEALVNVAKGDLSDTSLTVSPLYAATVIAVAHGYPGSYDKGKTITIPEVTEKDIFIFQAGTKIDEERLITNGGRVIAVTSLASNLDKALDKSYNTISKINFEGISYRKDIGRDLM